MQYKTCCTSDLNHIDSVSKRLMLKKILITKRKDCKTIKEYFDSLNTLYSNTFQLNSEVGFTNPPTATYRMLNYHLKIKSDDTFTFKGDIDRLYDHDLGNIYLGTDLGRFYTINTLVRTNDKRFIIIESLPMEVLMIDFTRHYYDTKYSDHKEWDDIFKQRTITVMGIDDDTSHTYYPNKYILNTEVKSKHFKRSISSKNQTHITGQLVGLLPKDDKRGEVKHPIAELLGYFMDKQYVFEHVYSKWSDNQKNTNSIALDKSVYELTCFEGDSDYKTKLEAIGVDWFNDKSVFIDKPLYQLAVMISAMYVSVCPITGDKAFQIKDFLGGDDITHHSVEKQNNLFEILSCPTFTGGKLAKIHDHEDHCEIVLTDNGIRLRDYCKENDIRLNLTFGLIFGYDFLRDVVHKVYFDKEYIKDFLIRSIHG